MSFIENNTPSPCKECTERSIGCHGKCEKYKKYRVIYQDEKQKIAAYFAEHSTKHGKIAKRCLKAIERKSKRR